MAHRSSLALAALVACMAMAPVAKAQASGRRSYDVLIRGGHVIDGTGNPWFAADVAIRGDRIAAIGDLRGATATRVIDARGLVVCPGFIDMLGHSEDVLLHDGRALSKLYQGITSEITGEGESIAPTELALPPVWRRAAASRAPKARTATAKGGAGSALPKAARPRWATLNGYFRALKRHGTAINLGTYVGAATVRSLVLGNARRAPTPAELDEMRALVDGAMRDGALGVSTALEYPPGSFASTDELIQLSKVAGRYGGIYASHVRDEGDHVVDAIKEAIRIGREAGVGVEIFHIKVMGRDNWGNMKQIVATINQARAGGVDVSADLYPYTAAGTGLAACLPPRMFAKGEREHLVERLRDPAVRRQLRKELSGHTPDWENLYGECGPDGILFQYLPVPDLKHFEGQTLSQAAVALHESPLDALFDILAETDGRGSALYFGMSENDLQLAMRQPWTSVGQDAGADSTLEKYGHPRRYGTFARILARYVRKLHVLTMEKAIRKMTSLAARREGLQDRGLLKPGMMADVTVFDPATIQDHATYERPGQFATGVQYVLVNGQVELSGGQPTGVLAGRPLRGPGWRAGARDESGKRAVRRRLSKDGEASRGHVRL